MSKVLFVIGSVNDLPKVKSGLEILKSLNISHKLRIASAHRTPDHLRKILAESLDVNIIIAAAGNSAHLAGVIAAHTYTPVIALPLSSSLSGIDSLLSSVQMPSGVPVACVGIDAAVNAVLFAARILALHDENIKKSLLYNNVEKIKAVIKSDSSHRYDFIAT